MAHTPKTSRDYESEILHMQEQILREFGNLQTYRCDQCFRLASDHHQRAPGSLRDCCEPILEGQEYMTDLKKQLYKLREFRAGIRQHVVGAERVETLHAEKSGLESQLSRQRDKYDALNRKIADALKEGANLIRRFRSFQSGSRSAEEVDEQIKRLMRCLSGVKVPDGKLSTVSEEAEVDKEVSSAFGATPDLTWEHFENVSVAREEKLISPAPSPPPHNASVFNHPPIIPSLASTPASSPSPALTPKIPTGGLKVMLANPSTVAATATSTAQTYSNPPTTATAMNTAPTQANQTPIQTNPFLHQYQQAPLSWSPYPLFPNFFGASPYPWQQQQQQQQ